MVFFGGGLPGAFIPSGSGAIGPFATLPDSCDSAAEGPGLFSPSDRFVVDSISLCGDLDRPVSPRLRRSLPFSLFSRARSASLSSVFFFFLIDDLLPDAFLLPEVNLFLLQLAPPWNDLLPHVHLSLDLSGPTSPSVQLVPPFVD